MELTITIISALVSLAGMGYKVWKQKQDYTRLELAYNIALDKVDKLGALVAKVTTIMLAKERLLRETESALAKLRTVPELVDELNGLRTPGEAADHAKSGR